MRNRWICISLLVLSLILVSVLACTSTPSLVGKWQNNEEELMYLEFLKDGCVIFDYGVVSIGKYELVGEDYVKFDFEGLGGFLISGTRKVNVSGDTMTLRMLGDNWTFKRVK